MQIYKQNQQTHDEEDENAKSKSCATTTLIFLSSRLVR